MREYNLPIIGKPRFHFWLMCFVRQKNSGNLKNSIATRNIKYHFIHVIFSYRKLKTNPSLFFDNSHTSFLLDIWRTHTAWKVSKYGVFSGPFFVEFFPVSGLNTEIYGVNLRISSKYRKIRTRKNSVNAHFSCSGRRLKLLLKIGAPNGKTLEKQLWMSSFISKFASCTCFFRGYS